MGQSSKLIHQYADYHKDIYTVTYEHDEKWVDFFKKSFSPKIKIKLLELENIKYKKFKTLTYKNVKKEFDNQQFNLILIDAPFGSKHYSRPQILELVPDILEQSFCIILDDYDRNGEKETAEEMLNILDKNNIKYFSNVYRGEKEHLLVCSENLKFLTSM
ncbi:MAG: hypothetical protein LBE36_14175 [Flavobacteriaceae bacterium]|nr:hypothetical protein [Flavobacteriaceae bacterium]